MAGNDHVLEERHGAVAVLTLNTPSVRNALTKASREQLDERLSMLETDKTCRTIVLTGAGNVFCAGGDIREMNKPADEVRSGLEQAQGIVRRIVSGPKPVIAAVEGFAYGAGLSLAAACDIVVTSAAAKFSSAFARIGAIPDLGLLWTLPRRIGGASARQVMLLSQPFDGSAALQMGLANELAEPGAVLAAALARAEQMAELAPLALRETKRLLAMDIEALDELLRAELDVQMKLLGSADHHEGRTAFAEKRKPVFTGC